MDFVREETFINSKKNQFKSLFGKEANENLKEFLMYLTDTTNRKLWTELEGFNKHIGEIKESGYFDRTEE